MSPAFKKKIEKCMFSDGDGAARVTTQHLACRKVNINNATTLMEERKDVLLSCGTEWNQVISILMDNCNEGKKTGVETQV